MNAAVLTAAVGTLGVAHGAFDLILARRVGLWRNRIELIAFFMLYALLVIAALRAWLLFPTVVLPVFLAASVWHFAGDWSGRLPVWQRLIAAAALVVLPAYAHPEIVSELFGYLVPAAAATDLVATLRDLGRVLLIAIVPVTLLALRQHRQSGVEIAAVTGLALALPPLLFFSVYFVGLHSIRHSLHALQECHHERGLALRSVVLLTAGTIAVATAVLFLLPAPQLEARLVQVVFIGLWSLTVPHLTLVPTARWLRATTAPSDGPSSRSKGMLEKNRYCKTARIASI
ncbi:MAG: Brp/Blh family beta-carotene 15,15'-dioxygenase [Gammaproteobacteria bacterium]|nr:Brp/Blh family beta-carotene 15,15'-dioxygenase [Gammaproteobacteria bacterium]